MQRRFPARAGNPGATSSTRPTARDGRVSPARPGNAHERHAPNKLGDKQGTLTAPRATFFLHDAERAARNGKPIMNKPVLSIMLTGALLATIQAQQPDNTGVNKRDRAETAKTADQAKETPADRDLMQRIRKAVTDDKTLSTYAHNVKIIAENGKVTLKGPVNSEAEKKNIQAKAATVAGAANVTDELTVAPENAKH
jgi:hyperosmotically inducible protein